MIHTKSTPKPVNPIEFAVGGHLLDGGHATARNPVRDSKSFINKELRSEDVAHFPAKGMHTVEGKADFHVYDPVNYSSGVVDAQLDVNDHSICAKTPLLTDKTTSRSSMSPLYSPPTPSARCI